ncbi:methionyl-tRNA formyltransferase [Tepidiforma sp.]|jgi:methionyl-tRNA formyltransferase|uniref:methionyl-tRNA formyltransferase n=1 Tax=Tepidiforma sp. TaxID=2682230 RepID=UPI00261ED600|nr:methionyl-tRNA formyltransferase [Tepidiforma sp.]MCX7618103.1 formyltransferase family protein [Tepidiforma sp.]
MRVVVMGQAAFGEAVFRRLREDGFDVAGVSAPAPAGGREDPLWAAASAAGVPVIETRRLKEAEGQEAWAALRPDLCVMAFVTEIIPHEVLELPRLGSIQYHPSLLPLHRGSSAINWAIIFGRTETGLTIFWPDRGIDTGPILLQRSCPIGPDDTVGSVYFERLFPMGVDAMAEAAALVRDGKTPRIPQDHAKATYEPPCRDEHAGIRWHEPADRLYALIRGCNPQPGAWTTFEGQRLRIFDCRLTGDEEPGMPGRVLRVEEGSFDVRLNGGVLRVLRVQPEGGKKVGAGEWAREAGLAAGYRFR